VKAAITDKATGDRMQALAEAEARQWERDFCKVMSTREGRHVIWKILEFTGPMQDGFTGNSTSFYNQGKQAAGKFLFGEMDRLCFDLYVEARTEAINRQMNFELEEKSHG
jgi:hypothetical protein